MFQLRLKNLQDFEIIKIAKKIQKITKRYKVKFIINDNPNIAKKINSNGCHIGQSDTSFEKTKIIIPNKIIGVTCHGSKKLINQAIKNNANYIAIGSFFASKLKPSAKKSDIKIIKWARKKTKKPIVVIGGINDKNYKRLIKLGANYIAISSFIWNNPLLTPKLAIKKFI